MIRRRWARTLTLTLALATPFTMGVLAPTRASAQEPGPEGGEVSEGRPLDGYLLTLCFAGAALFVIGKSARR